MYQTLLSVLKYLFLLGIGALFLYLAFKGQDTDKLLADLLTADYRWVLASSAACLLSHVFRAMRWNMLIRPLDHQPKLRNTFAAVMIGYLANLALPRLGEVSKCAALSKAENIPANQLIGTMLVERIFDFLMLLLVTALTLIVEYERIASFVYSIAFQQVNGSTEKLSAYALGFLLMFAALFGIWILIRKGKAAIPKKIVNFWNGVKNGLLSVKDIKSKKTFVFYSVMIWVLYLMSTYLCFFGLSATAHLTIGAALSTLFFGSIGMTLPVQGGIGTYHYMVAQGLTAYAINRTDGLAYATIIHSSQTLVILVIGSISLISLMLFAKKFRYAKVRDIKE
ncbi:MAG TPA: lysylphosphatidylglycerol synthase transmembrane domain-containing protein [Sphingobacteriaceae bacterium]